MTSAGATAAAGVDSCCVGVGWRTAEGVAISLAGDGERDLENKPELLLLGRATGGDGADLVLDESDTTTSLTRDGRSSLLIRLAGSHSFVFSLLIVVEVLLQVDELSKDERILEMDAVPPVAVGAAAAATTGSGAAAALGASAADPSNESEWKRERAFLTTDGLPSTGLAIDNRLPLLFNGEVAHSTAPSIGIVVVVTDNFWGRWIGFSSRRGLSATTCSATGVSSSCARAADKSSGSSADAATPFVCAGGATGSSSTSSSVAGFWPSGAEGGGDGE